MRSDKRVRNMRVQAHARYAVVESRARCARYASGAREGAQFAREARRARASIFAKMMQDDSGLWHAVRGADAILFTRHARPACVRLHAAAVMQRCGAPPIYHHH